MKKNVLIVEDESLIAMEISNYIQSIGYRTIATVSNAKDALSIPDNIDIALMDVYIKGDIDGITCSEKLQKKANAPQIIYISAFSDDNTLERAIATNPIAYLMKPFHPKELKIAMKIAAKQHLCTNRIGDQIFDDEFSFDTKNQELIYKGEVLHLTKKEKELLTLFVDAKNQVLDIYYIENRIWPDKASNDNTRRALIAKLRTKLNYKFLQTVHSVGYKLVL